MSNWLLELAFAIDQKSSDVAIETKQTKSHIKVLPLQLVAVRVIRIALGSGKDKDAVGPGSYASEGSLPSPSRLRTGAAAQTWPAGPNDIQVSFGGCCPTPGFE
jgi:hypothetical protein